MPSSGVDNRAASLPTAPLMAAAILLADRGVYGLVWIDPDLVVRARYGRLSDFVEIGVPVTDTLTPLIGLEDDMEALRADPSALVNVPAVSIVRGPDAPPRLNLTIFWSIEEQAYLLIISRAATKADLEVELSRHIRARLMTEAELKQKSRELEQANRDLEEYAAVISHDLKSPLRAMRYLADDLEGHLEAGGDASAIARSILARIRDQSRRMSGMLTALLDYASIGRKEEAVTTVDTLALIKEIIVSIPHPPGIRIELHGEWPVIRTLSAPLDLVLRNLIANAITHHDREIGEVRVVAIDGGGTLEITVADDGPGIAPQHHAAIFLPFRTLGDPARTGGHGMGLSFVKRTVESVNGRIAVMSNPTSERGAIFRVIWPKVIRL